VVSARSRAAQQLGLGGLGQQRLVAGVDRDRAAAGGQLHQRRRMRHLPIQPDPAEPAPTDGVRDLPAQALVAQPVAELEEHQPQVGLHRRRRPTHPRIEERRERRKEHRIIQQRIDPGQLLGQPQQRRRQRRLPPAHLLGPGPEHRPPRRAQQSLGAPEGLAAHSATDGATPSGTPVRYTWPEPGFFRAK
jgi:hypothetical protein